MTHTSESRTHVRIAYASVAPEALRAMYESEQRPYAVVVWHQAPFFTARERTALAWTEAVTLVSRDHVPDGIYEEARAQFSEKELVDLTMAVIAINGWNRPAVSFRAVAGTYQPVSDKGPAL